MTSRQEEYRDEVVSRALADMPLPAESPTFFEDLRARAVGAQDRRWRRSLRAFAARRPLALATASAVMFALLGGVVGAVAASGSGATSTAPVLAFTPADGWNTLQTRDATHAGIQFAWAANVPFAPADAATGEPIETVKTLPADGIAVYASTLPQVSEDAAYRDVLLPLKLSDGYFLTGQYENQPAPNVSKYLINAHVNGQYVFVEVYFGTPEPGAELLRAAGEELHRLSVPSPAPRAG